MRRTNYESNEQLDGDAYDENDVELLEKEIEQVIRCGTAKPNVQDNMFGSTVPINQRGQKPRTAAGPKRPPAGGKRRRIIQTATNN
jgi:hypothetical protein